MKKKKQSLAVRKALASGFALGALLGLPTAFLYGGQDGRNFAAQTAQTGPCPSQFPNCGTSLSNTCGSLPVNWWTGGNTNACDMGNQVTGRCYSCGTQSSSASNASAGQSSSGGACADLATVRPGVALPQYYSLNQRTVGSAPSATLNLQKTQALCDPGDIAVAGKGVIAACTTCGMPMLEFNGRNGTATQDGWSAHWSFYGDRFYDTVQTTVECLRKTPLFDQNYTIYHVVNDGGDYYALDQDRSVAFCNPGDKALGGGGNPPYCDDVNANPACGKTVTLVSNGVITQNGKEGLQVIYNVDGGNNDTQRTEVTCIGPKTPGACGGGTGPQCATICGDKFLAGAEECDDGNTVAGDGCSAMCKKEIIASSSRSSSISSGRSSSFVRPCGNTVVDSGEQCDDGNTQDNDGCSSQCMFERCSMTPAPPPGCSATPQGSPVSINRTCAGFGTAGGFSCQTHQSTLTVTGTAAQRIRGTYTFDVLQRDHGFSAPAKICGTATITFTIANANIPPRKINVTFSSFDTPSEFLFDWDFAPGTYQVSGQVTGVTVNCPGGGVSIPTAWKGTLNFETLQCTSASAASASGATGRSIPRFPVDGSTVLLTLLTDMALVPRNMCNLSHIPGQYTSAQMGKFSTGVMRYFAVKKAHYDLAQSLPA